MGHKVRTSLFKNVLIFPKCLYSPKMSSGSQNAHFPKISSLSPNALMFPKCPHFAKLCLLAPNVIMFPKCPHLPKMSSLSTNVLTLPKCAQFPKLSVSRLTDIRCLLILVRRPSGDLGHRPVFSPKNKQNHQLPFPRSRLLSIRALWSLIFPFSRATSPRVGLFSPLSPCQQFSWCSGGGLRESPGLCPTFEPH